MSSFKNMTKLLVIIGTTLAFSSCISDLVSEKGKGNIVSETKSVRNFYNIQLLTNANVTIKQDTGYRVIVEDYQNLVSYIETTVSSGKLVISLKPTSAIIENSAAKVTITMPDSLKTLSTSGSGSISVDSAFKDISSLLVTGSGGISLNKSVQLKTLYCGILGSGSISAKGTATTLNCESAGTGNIQTPNLQVRRANCYVSSSGNIYVSCDTLAAQISSSGNIYYKGNPVIGTSITGTGQLINIK